MEAEPFDILTTEQANTVRQTSRQMRRDNWAFSKGGGFDLVTVEGGRTFAVVEDISELTESDKTEITEALRRTVA